MEHRIDRENAAPLTVTQVGVIVVRTTTWHFRSFMEHRIDREYAAALTVKDADDG